MRVSGGVALVIMVSQWQFFRQGHWPGIHAICSFSIPIILAPIFIWSMLVPRLLEYSDEEVNLRTFLRTGSYRWRMLDAYGSARGLFMLQFTGDSGAYLIISFAYSNEEWSTFKHFLETRFPDRKASYGIGDKLIR
jgi:hypothetical protein